MASKLRLRFRKWRQRHGLSIVVLLLVVLFLIVLLSQHIFISMQSGEVGVQWSRLRGGTITTRIYDEGMHAILPWNKMTKYSVRFQDVDKTFDVMSKNGLAIEVEVMVRFRPVRSKIPLIHKYAGPEYVETLLVPELASHTRQAISKYEPAELYAEDRLTIQNLILKKLKRRTGISQTFETTTKGGNDDPGADKDDKKDKGNKKADKVFEKDKVDYWINIQDVFIKNINLPKVIADAIENKLRQEQLMLEYDFILLKEEKEKQRKIIEAQGIAEFQRITGGLSILKWKGIDATVSLASSPNAKLIVIGSSEEGGMPLILGPLSDAVPSSQVVPPPVQPAPVPPPGGAP